MEQKQQRRGISKGKTCKRSMMDRGEAFFPLRSMVRKLVYSIEKKNNNKSPKKVLSDEEQSQDHAVFYSDQQGISPVSMFEMAIQLINITT